MVLAHHGKMVFTWANFSAKLHLVLLHSESMTLQIEDFIPPDHTRANYAGLVLHGAHR